MERFPIIENFITVCDGRLVGQGNTNGNVKDSQEGWNVSCFLVFHDVIFYSLESACCMQMLCSLYVA
jgi:hypothetical protein